MDKTAAVALIRETFTQAFDEARFRRFARELFNHLDESKAKNWSGNVIPEAFKPYVRHYKRVGQYTTPQGEPVDVLVVYLTRQSALDEARTAQRNFLAHYLKQRGQKETAVAAFVGEAPDDWRFSLLRIDYRAARRPDGRIGVETDLTPARRFSFLVGRHEPNHTAQQQLLPILAETARDPSIADLEAAFNIESITREFFDRYKALFLQIQEALDDLAARDARIAAEFSRCALDTAAFAKKLLGQIVFLYFLQKKGWLGVRPGAAWGSGSHAFLGDLFRAGGYRNFFNDVLEPLFYTALAEERPDHFYPALNCRIPFLNGGLFEPAGGYDWRATDILLPDAIFAQVFETFDLYNFTVREDEPLEREVAVDPEMLGKVFENLLEVKDRKSKGAFYTPREIVHYMCQEALINYLDTALNRQEAPLAPDPARQEPLFGAPAVRQPSLRAATETVLVPRAELETFIRRGEVAAEYEANAAVKETAEKPAQWRLEAIQANAAAIDQALAEIKICDPAIGSGAFPVGMMSEIVRARQVLTSYLGQSSQRSVYAFKRQAIETSLYGVDIDPSAVDIARLRLWLSLVVDEDDFSTIQPLPNLDYKIVCGNSLQRITIDLFNQRTLQELEAHKYRFFRETRPAAKKTIREEIDRLIRQLAGQTDGFDYHIYFSEVFNERAGFDIVIANPPYVRGERISDQKEQLKKQFACFTGAADLYVYFYERGIELLRPGGALAFISSNKYFRSGYGQKLRAFLARLAIRQLIDFGDAPVFDAIAYPSIIILQNSPADAQPIQALTWKIGPPIQNFAQVFQSEHFALEQPELKPDGWRLESPAALRLLEKLRAAGRPLGEVIENKLYRGILTGLNEAFIVDQATRDRLAAADPNGVAILRPILRGRDIKRWQIDYAHLYLIKIESSENKRHPWSGLNAEKAEQVFAQTYPAVYAHLNQYRQALIDRDDQGKYFWELRSCKYWDAFEKPKIIYPDIAHAPQFSYDINGYYIVNTLYILPDQPKWLLGLLNSKTIHWFYRRISTSIQGEFIRFIAQYVVQIPVPFNIDTSNLPDLVKAHTTHLLLPDSKKIDQSLERALDQEVYRLFNLSDDEIALIESTLD